MSEKIDESNFFPSNVSMNGIKKLFDLDFFFYHPGKGPLMHTYIYTEKIDKIT